MDIRPQLTVCANTVCGFCFAHFLREVINLEPTNRCYRKITPPSPEVSPDWPWELCRRLPIQMGAYIACWPRVLGQLAVQFAVMMIDSVLFKLAGRVIG